MNWQGSLFMGGYALYVWGSYAFTMIALGGEVLLLLRRQRNQVAARRNRQQERS